MAKKSRSKDGNDDLVVPANEVPDLALQLLNAHGLAFQQSVVRALAHEFQEAGIPLRFCTQEFPVAVRNAASRVDFLFASDDRKILLLGECKRSDPRCAHWFFFRSSASDREKPANQVILEQLSFQRKQDPADGCSLSSAFGTATPSSFPIYRVASEGTQRERVDKQIGKAGEAVERACSQVAIGISGLVEHLSHIFSRDRVYPSIRIVPALFTTATLWASDSDIGEAAFSSGTLKQLSPPLRQVPWLLYEYTLSPGVKHSLSWTEYPAGKFPGWMGPHTHDFLQQALDLETTSRSEFRRTIAVVGPDGLTGFLDYLRNIVST